MQLRLAIDVAREFMRQQAVKHDVESIGNGRSPLQPLFKEITLLASDDAGERLQSAMGSMWRMRLTRR